MADNIEREAAIAAVRTAMSWTQATHRLEALPAAPVSEWRARAPTAAEVEAHSAANGWWMRRYLADGLYIARVRPENMAAFLAHLCGAGFEWRPYDADGNPVAWPEVGP